MKANILLIEYEPRYVERVRKALTEGGHQLEVAGDLDGAVEACARFEPHLVILTSVLPRLKLEDAITQLRARAGLRATPILILMSGYRGSDPKGDAVRYGAQDILERPFSADVLHQRVMQLLSETAESPTTQAIPEDMLTALRRSAGIGDDSRSLTSDELFGDILSDVEGEQQPVTPPPTEPKPAKPTDGAGTPATADSVVDQELADVLGASRAKRPKRRSAPSTDTEVDAILSQTLAGMDVHPVRSTPPPSAAVPEDAPETGEAPEPEMTPEAEPAPEPEMTPEAEAEPEPEETPEAEVAPEPEMAPEVEEAPQAEVEEEPAAAPEPITASKKAAPPERPEEPEPVAPPSGEGGVQFGQYVLMERIATGGMAEVFKARMMGMEGFQKTVAIKRILSHLTDNEEFVTMFIDEAKLAAQLNHNNIIHIYDLGKIDRSYYIAMEYIGGHDLRSILQDCRSREVSLPTPLALFIGSLLASALDHAHRKRDFENRDLGLVHRDVSPQNVLISTEGDIKLCDFGIAKAASKASHTRAGALKGKLQYMSPEQAWGKDIDLRSDVFSLGLVLYEMLTGEKLFAGDSELSILEQVRNPKISPPSDCRSGISPAIDDIVMRALAPDRDDRYQSAGDLQRDIEAVLRTEGWSPSRADLAQFLAELSSGEEISDLETGEPVTPPAGVVLTDTPVGVEVGGGSADEPPEENLKEDTFVRRASEERKQRRGLLLGGAALIAVVAGLVWIFGGGVGQGPAAPTPAPVVTAPSPTPTLSPELMEMVEKAALQEVAARESELRDRLEQELVTPTPLPVTPTPTPTETPTPEPSPTTTPVPPTPTRPPPTRTPVPPTPTPSFHEGDVVGPAPDVVAPELVKRVDPEYPPVARRMRYSGEVRLQLLVGTDGSVEDTRILKVTRRGVGFEKAAEDAVRQWRYRPAEKQGIKVRVWVTIRMPFTLR